MERLVNDSLARKTATVQGGVGLGGETGFDPIHEKLIRAAKNDFRSIPLKNQGSNPSFKITTGQISSQNFLSLGPVRVFFF